MKAREEFSHMKVKIRPKIHWLAALVIVIAILAIAALQHVRAADPRPDKK